MLEQRERRKRKWKRQCGREEDACITRDSNLGLSNPQANSRDTPTTTIYPSSQPRAVRDLRVEQAAQHLTLYRKEAP